MSAQVENRVELNCCEIETNMSEDGINTKSKGLNQCV